MSLEVRNLTHIYMKGTPSEVVALSDISFSVKDGEFLGLIGATGSGKSTLIQHLNGLLKPTSGEVLVDGKDIWGKGVSMKDVRRKVGLVFQYPEQQVFEDTVFSDVAFGPKNLGLSGPDLKKRVEEALNMVGLPLSLSSRSPFDLSGGQLRRVAIAGVVAMRPEVLILDEPAAGLDPEGRKSVLASVQKMHASGMTIILVSHNMEDVARLCQRLLVLQKGKMVSDGTPKEVFGNLRLIESCGLRPPEVVSFMEKLRARGFNVRADVLTLEEARDEILRELGRRRVTHSESERPNAVDCQEGKGAGI